MEKGPHDTHPVKGRLGRAVARVDAAVFSFVDRRAQESAGVYEDLPSVRSRVIRNKFQRSDKLGTTADVLRWAAQGAVSRHERRAGTNLESSSDRVGAAATIDDIWDKSRTRRNLKELGERQAKK